ncbi:N/A [soil metagenome]
MSALDSDRSVSRVDDQPVQTTASLPPVAVLGLVLPRMTQNEALAMLIDRVRRRVTCGVCFPNMSMLSVADEAFLRLVKRRMIVLNDGVGLSLVARMRGRPFPADLNFTDLCAPFLAAVPEDTSVYLVGARTEVVAQAAGTMADLFPNTRFVGHHHGYLDAATEAGVVAELARLRPQIIIVAMGNPLQVEFIDRHLDDPRLSGTMWLAVGGLLDRYGGDLPRRAPRWMLKAKLEWLHIVVNQPYKARRYFLGIPRFIGRCLRAQITGRHEPRHEV